MTSELEEAFFVYGTLKPRELGFGRIAEHVEREEAAIVRGASIYLRDGLPALVLHDDGRVEGSLLHPRPGHAEALAQKVSLFEPKHLYTRGMVDAVTAGGVTRTAITHFAKSPEAGFTELLEHGWWTAARDPLFRYGLPETRKRVEASPRRDVNAIDSSMPEFWEAYVPVLGHFLVLCSVLERFITFAYPGKSINERLQAFVGSSEAQSAVRGLGRPPRTVVYSTDRLVDVAWSASNPWDFWYQVRCNAVHRGKSAEHDLKLVASCARSMSRALCNLLAARFPDDAHAWR